MEDTEYGAADLRMLDFSESVPETLNLMTHDSHVPHLEYVAALKHNQIAGTVKLADLRQKSDFSRLESISGQDLHRVGEIQKSHSAFGGIKWPVEKPVSILVAAEIRLLVQIKSPNAKKSIV